MDTLSLASSGHGATRMTNPTSTTFTPAALPNLPPSRPAKAAQPDYLLPSHSSRQAGVVRYPSLNENYAHRSPPLPGTSFSSAGGTSVMSGRTLDTIDAEKGAVEPTPRQSESRRTSRTATKGRQEMAERRSDPQYFSTSGDASRQGSGASLPYDRASRTASAHSDLEQEQDMLDQRRMLESKALKILVRLIPSRHNCTLPQY